jgi:hypothetical protein
LAILINFPCQGGINEWDIEKGLPENPLMSEDEIKKWMNEGMEIGAHTQNHIHLSTLPCFFPVK